MKKKEQIINKKRGKQTVFLYSKPKIVSYYSVVGPKEAKGPMGKYFDEVLKDDMLGQKTFEKAEQALMEKAVFGAIEKSGKNPNEIDLYLSGDLLNQIISSTFTARKFDTTYIGLFGACSTMTESIALGACLVDGDYVNNALCATCSHFASAEKQFRNPLELGAPRPPTSQWTVTGAGACILQKVEDNNLPYIECVTFGKVTDFGVADVNNMGAAMAPAAMETLIAHFKETGRNPLDYDYIFTGDLGKLGSEILIDLMEHKGIKLGVNYCDCGNIVFDNEQKVQMGGSGCGCSASILNSFVLQKFAKKEISSVLFLSTGALLSPLSSQQGETIPSIAHAIVIRRENDI